MCALHMHIEQSKTQMTHGLSLSPPVASLIQSCVSSAQAILKTLRALADEDLIESEAFLPFQIEYASSSAFLLHLIPIICPSLLSDDSWREDARYVFDTLIAKGSLIAPLRKVELEQLEQKLSALTPASNVITPQLPTEANEGVGEHDDNQEQETEDQDIQAHLTDETGWDLFAANAMAGLTPGELLDLAEQLDVDSFMYQPDIRSCLADYNPESKTNTNLILPSASAAKRYRYLPLQNNTIRLVKILPGQEPLIQCEIVHATLGQNTPSYTALSYAWGDPRDSLEIDVDGAYVRVAVSLHGALHALRQNRLSTLVWADALCINQEDKVERGLQVRLMPRIYSDAMYVTIWLGPEENNSTRAVKYLERIATASTEVFGSIDVSQLLAAGIANGDILAVVSLFTREYWRRLWVVQEIFNAKCIYVYCGPAILPWESYRRASELFSQRRNELTFNNKYHDKIRLATSPDHFSSEQILIHQGPASLPNLRLLMSNGEEPLLQILRTCRRKLASDPRDKLYGILGVLPKGIRDHFRVDYGLSVKEVYTGIVRFLLKETERLDIICEAIHFPIHSSSINLPTFVPDWSHIPQTSAIGFKYGFSASGETKAIWEFLDNRLNKLKISALEVDVVKEKGVGVGTLCVLGDYLMAWLRNA
ncbi:hypothetical protein ACHAO9_008400 [Fusarium lateritium]